MANSLLDFVMSLVRDPDAAAAYAADPAQAIADANLTDVTSVDVNNLIPVVSESLSMAVPSTGADTVVDDHAGNVWASGAATAAFDAFDDHVPAVAADEVHSVVNQVVAGPSMPACSRGSTCSPMPACRTWRLPTTRRCSSTARLSTMHRSWTRTPRTTGAMRPPRVTTSRPTTPASTSSTSSTGNPERPAAPTTSTPRSRPPPRGR